MYQPSLLICGTRGLSEFKGMLLGSVSKYCLQHSPVPVAVVRPEDQLKKSQKKLTGLSRVTSPAGNSLNSEDEDENADKKFNRLSLTSSWKSKKSSRSNSPT